MSIWKIPSKPLRFPSGTIADHAANTDAIGERSLVKAEHHKNLQPTSKKKIVKAERMKKDADRLDPQDRKVRSGYTIGRLDKIHRLAI